MTPLWSALAVPGSSYKVPEHIVGVYEAVTETQVLQEPHTKPMLVSGSSFWSHQVCQLSPWLSGLRHSTSVSPTGWGVLQGVFLRRRRQLLRCPGELHCRVEHCWLCPGEVATGGAHRFGRDASRI